MDDTPDVINKYAGDNEGILTPLRRWTFAWTFLRLILRCQEVAAALSDHEFAVYRGYVLKCHVYSCISDQWRPVAHACTDRVRPHDGQGRLRGR